MLALFALCIAATPDGSATEQDYKIITDGSSSSVKAGGQGKLSLKVVPLNGFHVSDEAPFSVTITPSVGLEFKTKELGRDKSAKEPIATTAFKGKEKGIQSIKADLVFFLCTEKLCQRMSAQRELAVTVN